MKSFLKFSIHTISFKLVLYAYFIDYKDEYTKLSKSALVQDCRLFNEPKINAKKCIDLLNKI